MTQTGDAADAVDLSVVVPVYNESESIDIFWGNLRTVLDDLGVTCEVIFVDDGSKDDTPQRLEAIHAGNPAVKVVQLSRNFGHQAAITAGMQHSRGRATVLMDADMQDPPTVIPEMLEYWRRGEQVVVAVRQSRQDPLFRRFCYWLYHRMLSLLSDYPMTPNAGIFSLMDRSAVEELVRMGERNRFLPGLRSWIGFKQGAVLYRRQRRAAGRPKQSMAKLLRYGMDGIAGFSYKPLRLIGLMGVVISMFCFLWAILLVVTKLAGHQEIPGFTTLSVAILFLGGVQLVAIGILGEYLGRVYDEAKQRPLYVVSRTLDHDSAQEESAQDAGTDA